MILQLTNQVAICIILLWSINETFTAGRNDGDSALSILGYEIHRVSVALIAAAAFWVFHQSLNGYVTPAPDVAINAVVALYAVSRIAKSVRKQLASPAA